MKGIKMQLRSKRKDRYRWRAADIGGIAISESILIRSLVRFNHHSIRKRAFQRNTVVRERSSSHYEKECQFQSYVMVF